MSGVHQLPSEALEMMNGLNLKAVCYQFSLSTQLLWGRRREYLHSSQHTSLGVLGLGELFWISMELAYLNKTSVIWDLTGKTRQAPLLRVGRLQAAHQSWPVRSRPRILTPYPVRQVLLEEPLRQLTFNRLTHSLPETLWSQLEASLTHPRA